MTARIATAFAGAALWCLLALAASAEAQGSRILVLFHGCDSDEGVLLVQLASSAEMFEGDEQSVAIGRAKIVGGTARWAFEDVPPGRYALRVFHDENSNGKLDQRWGVGPPKEAFGFSNNVMGRFGPPSFDAAAFEHGAGGTELTIELKRF